MVIHVTSIPDDSLVELTQALQHQRADEGLLARFLCWALPSDPKAFYVFPSLAHNTVTRNGKSVWRFFPLVLLLFAATVAWSRLALQRHTPRDLVAGAVAGALAGLAFWPLATRWTG